MLIARNICPINYDTLCNQTVTVYRKTSEDGVISKVYKKAFFDFKKAVSVDKVGTDHSTSFLLVIPGSEQAVYPGDKVLLGTGPEYVTEDEWLKEFLPAKVDGLAVVKYADPKYWNGQLVHTEAGG